ncbi:unnamed protein product [Polarella glacialis]|uniref:Peptidase A1 domain-containing protein n=1 Tax=Polarella glacialis TaxID=89957 RepID=A0A813IP91_POLGL|nr:unnamed protein product [Polarella glacialis]
MELPDGHGALPGGRDVCETGLSTQGLGMWILGDVFLRLAVVVHDPLKRSASLFPRPSARASQVHPDAQLAAFQRSSETWACLALATAAVSSLLLLRPVLGGFFLRTTATPAAQSARQPLLDA